MLLFQNVAFTKKGRPKILKESTRSPEGSSLPNKNFQRTAGVGVRLGKEKQTSHLMSLYFEALRARVDLELIQELTIEAERSRDQPVPRDAKLSIRIHSPHRWRLLFR